MDTLRKICHDKGNLVHQRMFAVPEELLREKAEQQTPPRGFIKALERVRTEKRYGLICEIKKASPSRGLIRADFDPGALARAYEAGGATCLSVLTDTPYFQGKDEDLFAARAACNLPVLRKDFMLHPYQVLESRALGADCILIIMAALTDERAAEIENAAHDHGMDVLIEVHDEEELHRALQLKSPLLGINNRDLKTLAIDIATTEKLSALVPPDRILVSESGLYTGDDLARMSNAGASCFLIGESLMKQDNVTAAVQALMKNPSK